MTRIRSSPRRPCAGGALAIFTTFACLCSAACDATTPATPPLPETRADAAFDWPVPEGWTPETIPFPIDFAPGLPFHGVEELRFAPGFSKPQASTFWTYAFVWWLDDPPSFDTPSIAPVLREYFAGLALAVGRDRFPMDPARFRVELASGVDGSQALLVGQVSSYDPFVTGDPIVLNAEVRLLECPRAGRRAITFLFSPRPFTDPVWEDLRACASALRCE